MSGPESEQLRGALAQDGSRSGAGHTWFLMLGRCCSRPEAGAGVWTRVECTFTPSFKWDPVSSCVGVFMEYRALDSAVKVVLGVARAAVKVRATHRYFILLTKGAYVSFNVS